MRILPSAFSLKTAHRLLLLLLLSRRAAGRGESKMLEEAAAALLVILSVWFYRAARPPPPKLCGTPSGPPVTSPRIKLRDGRFLAYKERGAPKHKAKHKIIHVHGFDSTKDSTLPASQELMDELGIYYLSFDRAGYGESDPNPKRTVKSDAMDIEELADQLEMGSKFYLVGVSMGAYPTWSCLYYIPHRLRGVALLVPAVNYWWPSLPPKLAEQAYSKLPPEDRSTMWIAHHCRFLLYLWMTQKWLPGSDIAQGHAAVLSDEDREIKRARQESLGRRNIARQQGDFESIHRDMMVLFSDWEFDPVDIPNPFPGNEGSVHIWQGCKDKMVQVEVQRYIAEKLPWIHYHENPRGGHLFMYSDHWSDAILRALLLPQDHSFHRKEIIQRHAPCRESVFKG